jgi:hypothetical protein
MVSRKTRKSRKLKGGWRKVTWCYDPDKRNEGIQKMISRTYTGYCFNNYPYKIVCDDSMKYFDPKQIRDPEHPNGKCIVVKDPKKIKAGSRFKKNKTKKSKK